ncbi:RNA polymerase sigma factor [Roseivirga thermotolerans]|uniref:RNA polymerase sigma factor n=1 Tax=Roseivirga thermotolerans TaxID=1758176 RepID=UPI00273E9728|nr:sigma-70 family RNA polymerase sigma factor [Roseivirga thermotolerans]
MEQHKGIVIKVANAYSNTENDRDDLIQEVSYNLWKSWPNYNPKYKLSTWVYTIALNVSISFYRKHSKRVQMYRAIEEVELELIEAEELDRTEEVRKLLYRFIGRLRPLDRALMLLYLDEQTYDDMAAALGISKTNVATKISRIKKVLKQQFEREERGS